LTGHNADGSPRSVQKNAVLAVLVKAVQELNAKVSVQFTDAVMNTLSVSGGATFAGGLMVDNISSIGEFLSITSDTEFFGTPYLNKDTAGFAVIRTGTKEVDVVFEKEYIGQPIVNATITLEEGTDEENIFTDDIRYVVTRKNVNGFTILLNENATTDIKFSWIAFAVRDPNIFFSLIPPTNEAVGVPTESTEPTSEPEAGSPPAEEPTNPPITENPTLEPSSEPEPEAGSPPAEEPAPEPMPDSEPESPAETPEPFASPTDSTPDPSEPAIVP